MSREERERPLVAIVGGPDADARAELAAELTDEFSFVALGSSREAGDTFARIGVPYHAYPMAPGANPAADVRMLLTLRSRLCHIRPDVVHAFDTKPAVWGRLAARWAGVPIVVGTLPGLGYVFAGESFRQRALRKLYLPLQRLASRLSDLTICQNAADLEQLVREGVAPRENLTLIPGSGVRTDWFDRARVDEQRIADLKAGLGIDPGAVVVTMVSRIVRSKGVIEYAGAAGLVRAKRPNVRFVLAGSLDSRAHDVPSATEVAMMRQEVCMPGQVGDIRTLLAASDVFVLPSKYREGIPRVLLEAGAMALPSVTTRTPGCADAVEDGVTGYLVAPGDRAALADALLRLVSSAELREHLGKAARARVQANFTLKHVTEATRAVYRHLLASMRLASSAIDASHQSPAPSSLGSTRAG